MNRSLLVLVLVVLAAVGCGSNTPDFIECRDDTSCDLAADGRCLVNPATGNQFCAYPDSACESGMRWSELDVEQSISGTCVAEAPDAGVDAPPDAPDAMPPDAGQPEANFARRYGSFGYDSLNALAVGSGGFVIAGYFRDDVDFGGGLVEGDPNGDMIIARYTTAGAFAWDTHFGGTQSDAVHDVALTAAGDVAFCATWAGTIDFGDGPVTSTNAFNGDVAIGKLSGSNGSPIWVRTLRSDVIKTCEGVAVDPSGDVIAVGSFSGTVDFGNGNVTAADTQMYVAKYDGDNGALTWVLPLGGTGADGAFAVETLSNGDLVVAGRFRETANFGGGNRTALGSFDAVVIRLSSAAAYQWDAVIGSAGQENATSLVVDGSEVYVGGFFSGTIENGATDLETFGNNDGFLARLSAATGARTWIVGMGGTSIDQVHTVAIDTSGNPVVAGFFYESADFGNGEVTSAGEEDIFVSSYAAATGAFVDARRFGGTLDDRGHAIAPGNDSNLYLGGMFRNTVDFGAAVLTAPAPGTEPDMFIVRYMP